jgi:hypothetical protein
MARPTDYDIRIFFLVRSQQARGYPPNDYSIPISLVPRGAGCQIALYDR